MLLDGSSHYPQPAVVDDGCCSTATSGPVSVKERQLPLTKVCQGDPSWIPSLQGNAEHHRLLLWSSLPQRVYKAASPTIFKHKITFFILLKSLISDVVFSASAVLFVFCVLILSIFGYNLIAVKLPLNAYSK